MIVFPFFLFFLVIVTGDGRSINNIKPLEENFLYEGDILLPKKNLEFGRTSEGRLVGKLKSETAGRRNLIVKDRSLRWTFPINYHIDKDGHAFGFAHEHKHFKREAHVVVKFENVNSTEWHNFDMELESEMEDFGISYDHGSVMHYSRNAFSMNNKDSIQTVDPNFQSTIGQDVGPSFADVKKLNFAYCNATCPNTLNCTRGGYINPNDCSVCKCPVGFEGKLCEKVAVNIDACGASNLTATGRAQTIHAAGAKTCYYLIKAPVNKRVMFKGIIHGFPKEWQCAGGYVEINYNGDFTVTGARFCSFDPPNYHSQQEEILIIYKGSKNSLFGLFYRYDDSAPSTTALSVVKTNKAASDASKKIKKN
ncbi:hypothetical protein CAEBREN_02929 [Caenorhabditis brenneri]|uniref:Metalloendopeptidase n=1 Tax=Caenorhabditis brenneri TaxID=135651 RepID=G0MAJ6_CAEBE|nr:hypothetical protein CAEBREN_02929 [Caenorhabditis brenneri]